MTENEASHRSIGTMTCFSCELAFGSNLNAFIDHMTDVHIDDRIQCTFCDDQFSSGAEYAVHFIYYHSQENENGAAGAMQDPICSPTSSTEGENYECPSCEFRASRPEILSSHFEECHSESSQSDKASCSEISHCPVCSQHFPQSQLNGHVNSHFEEGESTDHQLALELDKVERAKRTEEEAKELALLQKEYGMDESGSYNQQGLQALNRAYGKGQLTLGQLYDAKLRLNMNQHGGVEDPNYCVKNPVNNIREMSRRCSDVLDVHLCTAIDHYSTSNADFGFGCGYRNIQMMLSSLRHCETYRKALWGNGPVHMPSIPKVQELIEDAWRKGFDSRGCAQLNGRLRNTRKWIGATEAAVFFQSYRVKMQLIDVSHPTGPKSTHPLLLRWCYDYCREGSTKGAFVAPLYFQHQGHSRTIIGVERTRSGQFRLLIFDPSHNRQRMQQLSNSSNSNDLRLIRKTATDLTKSEYQLVAVKGLMEDDQQYEWYKTNFDFLKFPPNGAGNSGH